MTVEPYDHLRVPGEGGAGDDAAGGDDGGDSESATTAATDLAPGVHRVVGVGEGVTLLRVTDGDGRRVRSGRVERVDAATADAMPEAGDPDARVGPRRLLASMADGLVWTLRSGLRRLVP